MKWREATRAVRRPGSGWPVVIICSTLALLAGARLVMLSMQQHAAQARSVAQQLAERSSQALEQQLQRLYRLAEQRASQNLSSPLPSASGTEGTASPPHEFMLLPDGTVRGAAASEGESVSAILADAGAVGSGVNDQRLLGPIREGSRWLVAARAPLQDSVPAAADASPAWAVVYQDLDVLLLGAQLDRAVRSGYDFQLARFDTASAGELTVATSASAPLSDPVESAVRLPATLASVGANPRVGGWTLALQPKAGWFPLEELLVDVSLVLLVTWLIGLGIRDATRHIQHLRTALAVSRKRLQHTQETLSNEIEQRQRLQRSFEHAHYHDSFTGLPNRHYFLGQLDRALRDMRTRSGYRTAVLLIAVDRYKVITDTLGHTAGDELMVQVTRLFGQVLSGNEHVLARWADDELALLLADANKVPAVSETAQALQQELQAAIVVRRHRVMIATSIGATLVESGLARAEEVMREADVALSSARSSGGANLVTYSPAMQHQFMQIVSLEGDLHMALEREEFRLRFQPIVDLQARQIVGVEALLRWMHPLEGLLPPSRFLSFAEEAGLIVPITRWIIMRACKLAAYWHGRLGEERDFFISINLSPGVLLDPELTEYVGGVLRDTGAQAQALKFELTENGLISNVGVARDVLDKLHSMGVELMLDDFGTGYSSLSHLQVFPFSYIKIDGPLRSRLGGEQTEGGELALMQAMAQMASTLGLKTIAEVVETTAAVEALQQIGCQYAQGNVFCAPVDADQALQRLISNRLDPHDEPEEDLDSSPTLILPVLPEQAMQ
jgi:diguanylate cyclase (GGDEF)-like protein